jgi:hypothetical protein
VDIGPIIDRSARLIWRVRYLWLLALFGAADFATPNLGPLDVGPGAQTESAGPPLDAGVGETVLQVLAWVRENWVTLASTAATVAVALLVFLVLGLLVSSLATGAMIRATSELDGGRAYGLRAALRAGLSTLLRVFLLRTGALAVQGLWLGVLFLPALWPVLTLPSRVGDVGAWGRALLGAGALSFGLLLAGILPWLVFGVLVNLALRSIVLEQQGVVAALRRAWRLLVSQFPRVVVAWLVSVGLGAALLTAVAAVEIATAMLAPLVTLVGPDSSTGPGMALGLAAWAVDVAAALLCYALAGGFFSVYWTLVFQRLERVPAAAEVRPFAAGQG